MKKSKLLYGLIPILLIGGLIAYVAYRTRPVPTPARRWKRFYRPGTKSLDAETCLNLQGIYAISAGPDFFGDTAVMKWSYVVERNKLIHRLSVFCEKNGLYIICEGKQRGDEILLSGHWRKAAANGAGLVRLVMAKSSRSSQSNSLRFDGYFGEKNNEPGKPLSLAYLQALPDQPPFDIIGHRGGVRNVDFLPVSENTLEMLKMASALGATGVEIDVRITKDGVPVIFHDSFLSIHTVKGKLYGGMLHQYSLQELKAIELRKGGSVPTVEEALYTMLYETPLEMVWLDIKKECDLEIIRQLQEEYTALARAAGRNFRIYIGIPDEHVLRCFKELEDYQQTPSITELEAEIVFDINAKVWAPQYTKGRQDDAIAKLHAAGKKVFVWSLDSKTLIEYYIGDGKFDGVVTNTPSVVAHWLYTAGLRSTREVALKQDKT